MACRNLGCARAWASPFSAGPAAPAPDGVAFSEQWLFTQAENLARKPFAQPELKLPSELADLDQQKYQAIRYKADAAVWKDDPFNFDLQFFHTGFQYKVPVEIHLIDGGVSRPFPYSTSLFEFGAPLTVPPADSQSGFSGVRVHAPIHRPDAMDPFLTFQGASYFRSIATGQAFGMSARAVSINTAQPSGEEFPFFRALWIQKPAAADRQLLIYALLDGPSVAGVYKFRAEPGRFTVMDVEATLFPRKVLTHVGIAPLTSMYYFGTADGTQRRRLPAERAQLQRLADLDRHGRVDLATARQSRTPSIFGIFRQDAQGLRTAPAATRLP